VNYIRHLSPRCVCVCVWCVCGVCVCVCGVCVFVRACARACVCGVFVCAYIYIYTQGVPGGMCQTLGGCSLC